MSKELTIQISDIQTNVTILKDYPTIIEEKTEAFLKINETIGDLTSDDKRNDLTRELKALKQVKKTFNEKRMAVTKVLDMFKKNIMEYEADEIAVVDDLIMNTSSRLTKYDRERELERQEEQRKKEEEIAKAHAEQEEKNKRHTDLITGIGMIKGLVPEIKLLTDANKLPQYWEKHSKVCVWEAEYKALIDEFDKAQNVIDARTEVKNALLEAEKRLEKLATASEEERLELEKKAEEQAKIQEAIAEEELKQAKIKQAEEEEKKFEEQQAKLKELEEMREKKLKHLNLGFDIDIEDIDKVPDKYIKKDLKKADARKDIKSGIYIEGLKVTLKDGTVLKKEEYSIL